MASMAPTHSFEAKQFEVFSPSAVAVDLTALAILIAGLYWTWKRNPFGYAIMAINIALFPVLRVISAQFDPSLYHERYVMTGLALATALLPCMTAYASSQLWKRPMLRVAAAIIAALWLGAAILNIGVTLPLWSNHARLWQWDLAKDPESTTALAYLLALDDVDNQQKHAIADQVMSRHTTCTTCLINVAAFSIGEGDSARAEAALDLAIVRMSPESGDEVWQAYIIGRGQLNALRGDVPGATEAFTDAIGIDPSNPKAHFALALALASQGRSIEARAEMEKTLALLPPDERASGERAYELAIKSAEKSMAGKRTQAQ